MGRQPVFIRVLGVIDFGGAVNHNGFLLADALKPMVDKGGNLEKDGVVLPHEEFVDFPEGGRLLPAIIQD